MEFLTGLLGGFAIIIAVGLLVLIGIVIRHLRPLGWAVLIGGVLLVGIAANL